MTRRKVVLFHHVLNFIRNVSQIPILPPLLKITGELTNLQQKFFTENAKNLLSYIKSCEDLCDMVAKSRGELQKLLSESAKSKDKFHSSKETEANNTNVSINNERVRLNSLPLSFYHFL